MDIEVSDIGSDEAYIAIDVVVYETAVCLAYLSAYSEVVLDFVVHPC